MKVFLICILSLLNLSLAIDNDKRAFMNHYKKRVKRMFYHAYNGYLEHAYPYDELMPISCKGFLVKMYLSISPFRH